MLVDDDEATNFINEMVVKKVGCAEQIHVAENGQQALDFLKKSIDGNYPRPDLIFLDINMPIMDGWEFLERYQELDAFQKGDIIIVMLTTSFNPYDRTKADEVEEITGFKNKPLTREIMQDILQEHFADRL